ncbi:ABC transporter permease [Mucilaginibacter sp. UC70_90]
MKYNDRQFKEEHVQMIDANFLRLFSIPLIDGDDKACFTEPNSMVVTRAMANKYFGDQEAVGKSVTIDGKPYKVTGVIDKVPDDSHFHGDAFLNLAPFVKNAKQTWSNIGFFTYVVLDRNASPKKLEASFPKW